MSRTRSRWDLMRGRDGLTATVSMTPPNTLNCKLVDLKVSQFFFKFCSAFPAMPN